MTGIVAAVRGSDVCATWAQAGLADDHLVYEGADGWVFAGGMRAEIRLTVRAVTVTVVDDETGPRVRTSQYSHLPAQALEEALAGLGIPDWRVYGWVGFDFCAPYLGVAEHLRDDDLLGVLFVPRFEAFVSKTGQIRFEGGDDQLHARMRALAQLPFFVDESRRRPLSVEAGASEYRGAVAAAIAEIKDGRYEKVIVSREVQAPFDIDIAATYSVGRAANNPARSFLLRLDGLEAAGFSPELVGSVSTSGRVTTEPLAGTRAFGQSPEQDENARTELLGDAKEIVEHAISVRTSFAEVASVAIPGSTAVTEYMTVRERGSVQHLASTVVGELAPTHSAWDALEVLFPSVTASGIPKSPAVDAIYRLEATRRGLYSGAVVTASADGDLEASLVLRSVFRDGNRSWLRAGAGVVGQSSPDREFIETCEKLGSVAPYVVAAEPQAGQLDGQPTAEAGR